MKQRKKDFAILAGLIFLISAVFAFTNRLSLGTDLTSAADEGFYMDAAYKYFIGYELFKDEIYTTTRGFDLYLGSLFRVFGDQSVLFWRKISLIHILLIISIAILSMHKSFKTKSKATLFLLFPMTLFVYCNLWSLSYVTLMPLIILLAYSMLMFSFSLQSKKNSYFLAVCSGAVISTLIIVYTPAFLIILTTPVFIFLFSKAKLDTNIITRSLAIYFSSALLFSIFILFYLYLSGHLKFAIENIKDIQSLSQYTGNRLVVFFKKIIYHNQRYLTFFAVAINFVIGYTFFKCTKKIKFVLTCIVLAFYSYFLVEVYRAITLPFSIYDGLGRLNIAITSLALGVSLRDLVGKEKYVQNMTFVFLITNTLFLCVIILMVSANGFFQLNNLTWLFWLFNLGFLFWRVEISEKFQRPTIQYAMLLTVFFASCFHFQWVYFDQPIKNLTYTIKTKKLAKIKTNPERGKFIDDLCNKIKTLTLPNTYVLFFDNTEGDKANSRTLYGFNYLTSSSPPLKATILRVNMPNDKIARKWIEQMKRESRSPEYVVTTKRIYKPIGALEKYIHQNFHALDSSPNYTIYKTLNQKHPER